MRALELNYITEAMSGELYSLSNNPSARLVRDIAIDSRNVKPGDMFFCIVGARSDAHKFLPDVRDRGCHTAVVSNAEWADRLKEYDDMNVILVEDTTWALVNLATRYMDDWEGLTRVAVTGSVGKTSTKEFIYSVLSSKYKTGKNPGNLNSEWGIPLSCCGFADDIEVSINEIGLGYSLDMKYLVNIIKPQLAVVTTIGSSHLEDFGSREELLKAKLRITCGLPEDGSGVLIVNSDCKELSRESIASNTEGEFRIVSVGSNDDADYILSDVKDNGVDGVECKLSYRTSGDNDREAISLKIPIVGAHNLFNAALAVAVGVEMGISVEEAAEALGNTEKYSNRLDVRRGKYIVINDSYNASPESMKAGIDVVINSRGGRRIAVLGDMFELGNTSEALHSSVGEYGANRGLDMIITIGKLSKAIAEGARRTSKDIKLVHYDSLQDAIDNIHAELKGGDIVLVKASNSMKLYELADSITE